MKILISSNGITRELVGSFDICGSAEDLHSIGRQLLNVPSASYGWQTIVGDKPPILVNTPPRKWEE